VLANEYQQLAMRTANPIVIGDYEKTLLNAVLGLCGEAGECADTVKKVVFHGHDLDKSALTKELGDILWYVALAATALDTPLEEIMQGNIDKLRRRYPEGFSTEASKNRSEP
jgi:NTP pyrophosphatase (non-canonical NTP hydrolase)